MSKIFILPEGFFFQLSTHIDAEVPMLEQIEGVESFDHGTFRTHPYYAFIRAPQAEDGPMPAMLLVSDGGLIAELTYIEGSTGENTIRNTCAKFKVKVREPLGSALLSNDNIVLSFNDNSFHKDDGVGFAVTGTSRNCNELPSGPHPDYAYYLSKKNPPSGMTQTWGDVFVHRQYGLEIIARSYNAVVMDLKNFQNPFDQHALEALPPEKRTQVEPNKHVLKFPDDKSKNYDSLPPVPVPYGWKYLARSAARGAETSRMVSSSADVMNSVKREAGFHVKGSADVNIGPVSASANFSVTNNKAVSDKIQNVTESKQTVTEHRIIQTEYALVMDKRNARLDDKFKTRLKELQLTYNKKNGLSDLELDDFFDKWGTHYVYAATFGAKGTSVETYSEDTVKKLIESEVDLKSAWSAGVSLKVFGSGGSLDGGQDTAQSDGNHNQVQSVTGRGFTSWDCVGGGSCSQEGPGSGTDRPPIYLDLRPLSELLGPPFFSDHLTAVTLRGLVSKGIDRYAFVPKTNFGEPAFSAAEIEFVVIQVEVDPAFSTGGQVTLMGPLIGLAENIVIKSPPSTPFNDYQKGYWVGVGTQGSTKVTVIHDRDKTIDVKFAMYASKVSNDPFSMPENCGWLPGREGTFTVDPSKEGSQLAGPFKHPQSNGRPGVQVTFRVTVRMVDMAPLLGLNA